MKKITLLAAIGLYSFCLTAQVGINTTNPQRTLDVNGKIMIQDLGRSSTGETGVKMLLTESDGTVLGADLPDEFSLTDGGELKVSLGSATTEKIVLSAETFDTKNNWDLDLDGDNTDVTMIIIRKASGGGELKIRGIQGGTDGRRIQIINDSGYNIKFEEDKAEADPGNRIYIYTDDDKMDDYGACVLVYSTAISDSGGHWNLIQLDENKD
ncbi:hypothetical protein [Aureitalea marina]|uniref:Uncharacterized protein n=1 Tax=Aureitalea marina TaxID=930804 RepID=A0A2S7KPN2_9FLAO|nr:hypothetical protein [Aureitalea marina]PQB04582.1 hypothetical protein BST85_06470 [Aureitalea marina]